MKEKWKQNKALYQKILFITLPIILQNLLSAAVSSADVLMLNYVGQDSLSAGSLATQYSGLAFMFFYGIGTGVTMLCAQYWGKGDINAMHKVEGIAMRFSLIIAGILALSTALIPETLMRVFTNEEALIVLGGRYLRVVAPCFIFWAVTEVYLAVLRSAGRVSISTVIEVVALGSNVILNAVLIFGLFGAPRMGIMGVALATTISRGLSFFLCLIVSIKSENVKMVVRPIFERHPQLSKDFITMALPAVGNDMVWSLAFAMYSVILGHLGSDVVAANSIVSVVRNLGSVFCFAIGSAAGIIVGQILGENQIEEGKKAGRIMLRLSVYTGILGGLIVLALVPTAMKYAMISEQALKYLRFMLFINVYYIMGTAVNTTLIAGVFRAGGDSRFGFVCDTIDMWVYAVPLGFFAAFVLKLPVEAVYFLLCTDEFVKWPWVFKHFFSYKWAKNITRDDI
ncbi:MAG: MATE family efflux transporter [Lachnospiraceae bacterium]|nr:MATE family efflux transporter [Lachnospiraceae bacterium]